MKTSENKAKKTSSRISRGRPVGSMSNPALISVPDSKITEKDDFKWLAELHTMLSPYWSARFTK